MNKNTIIKLGGAGIFALTASVTAIIYISSTTAPRPDSTLAGLSGVSAAELPAAAARLVLDAKPESRAAVAREVVQATVALTRPSVLPYVVSAVCEAAPEVAPAVAVAVAQWQPSEALASVKAAVAAAPDRADQIVFAIVQQFPQIYAPVAALAAQAAPVKIPAILKAVASAQPELEPYIASAVARNGGAAANIATVLEQSQTQVAAVNTEKEQASVREATAKPALLAYAFQPPPPQPPPRVDPPFTTFVPNPVVIHVSDTAIVTPGTVRNYSAP